MSADAALQKKRLTAMLVINAACFVLAGAAIYGAVSLRMDWLRLVFLGAIVVGLGSHVWFILGWMRGSKGEGSSS